MSAQFQPGRLIERREVLGITKAEAARRLSLSKIGYCRYEYGDRTPSAQTLEVISQCFGTSVDYLVGLTDDPSPQQYVIEKESSPELFTLIESCQNANSDQINKLLAYCKQITNQ